MSRNVFVSLAIILDAFSSLCSTKLLLVSFLLLVLDWSSSGTYFVSQYCFWKLIWLLSLPLVCFLADKAPFDLVEAESELVDGITTDASGIVFSFIFSAETFHTLVLFLLLGLLNPNALLLIFGIFAFALSFVGRVVLPRILISDALEGTIQVALALVLLVLL